MTNLTKMRLRNALLTTGMVSSAIPLSFVAMASQAHAADAVNSASVTAPSGALEANTANNAATDSDKIYAVLVATNDTASGVNGASGATAVANAFTSDTVNGVAASPSNATLSVKAGTSVPAGLVFNTATGSVDVAAGTPAGSYVVNYTICETLNPSNCKDASITVEVVIPNGGISGTVYQDSDGDRIADPNEPRLANWIVEIVQNGVVIATVRSDDQGNYSVPGLAQGSGYTVQFRSPENNVLYGRIENVTVSSGTTVVDQNRPIDPSGVVYNSVTRAPVAGARMRLTDNAGIPLPIACFLDASQASQTTGASGAYRFDIIPGAAPQCPTGETVYHIEATPPAGFSFVSTVLLPQSDVFDPTGRVGPVRVAASNDAPTDASPVYYLNFRLASGDPDVVNNHIAIDPFLSRTPLVVTKTSTKRSANIGDVVPYEITVRNTETAQRAGVDVVDILPPGMKYVLGSSTVNGIPQEPVNTNNNRQLLWSGQVIPANGSVRYNLMLVVGAGVTGGEKVNTGLAQNGSNGAAISNRGTAVVQIVPSSVFDCSELLGKVFEDRNANGYQDEGEPGVPGVRVVTVNGQLITTDSYGRYHIACAAVPDARIGSNFVLKIDERTLPLGWVVTTDNPRSIRLTRGKFGELNFGVAPAAPQGGSTQIYSAKPAESGE